jgi:predicted small secreted protein
MRLPLRPLLIALFAVATLAACNTWSGVKQDSRQVADYTYEKKEEYQRKLESQMRDLDARTDELKIKAASATDSVKREFDKDMNELSRQKSVLGEKLESVRSSTAGAWDDTKAGAESAWDAVKRTYERARARFQ